MPTRSRQRPSGTRYQMTAAWKATVLARLRETGQTKSDLAAAIGVSKSVITLVLGPDQTASAYVPAICAHLELPMPALGADEDLLSLFGRLSPEDQETLLLMAKRMLK